MHPELTPRPLPPDTTSYVFQRLERVKDRLTADALLHVLDAPQRAWYLHTTAAYLAPHLLEAYRRRVEAAAPASGLDAVAPALRPWLTVATDAHGQTTVQLGLDPPTTQDVVTTLTKNLRASNADDTWDTLARRLAMDLITWALEKLGQRIGAEAIAAMPERTFEAALLADAWPEDPAPLQDRVRHFLTLAAQQAAFDIATTIAARAPALEALEHLLGFRHLPPATASLESLLRVEHLTVLSAAHYQAVREALATNTFRGLCSNGTETWEVHATPPGHRDPGADATHPAPQTLTTQTSTGPGS